MFYTKAMSETGGGDLSFEKELGGILEDNSKIEEILSKDGMTDALRRFEVEFTEQPGKPLFIGITTDGIVAGVRAGVGDMLEDTYYQAWAIDATLPAEEIDDAKVVTHFDYRSANSMRGQFPRFPSHFMRDRAQVAQLDNIPLEKLRGMSEDEVRAVTPNRDKAFALFYKITGGFQISGMGEAQTVTLGGKRLHSLNLQDTQK